jgi:hypothetical protein
MKGINDYFEEMMSEIKNEVDELYTSELEGFKYIGNRQFINESEETFTLEMLIGVFDEWVYNHIQGSLGTFVRGYLKSKLIEDYNII